MGTEKLDNLLTPNEQLIAQLEKIRADAERQMEELAQTTASQADTSWLDATKEIWLDATKEIEAIAASQTEKVAALQASIDEHAHLIQLIGIV